MAPLQFSTLMRPMVPLQFVQTSNRAVVQINPWATFEALDYTDFLYQVGIFALAFLVTYLFGRVAVVPITDRLLRNRRVTETVRSPATRAVRVLVVVTAFFVGLVFARLNTLLSVSGGLAAALTLAIGFASRDILGNLVGGVFIITDSKFNIGDWIEWNGNEGVVEDISFRVTRVRTFDNQLITVPNSMLAGSVVINHAIKNTIRVDYTFGVEYGDEVDAMRRALVEEARANRRILDDPAPKATIDDVTAAGVDLSIRFWVRNPSRQKYLDVRSEYLQDVIDRFRRDGFALSPDLLELRGELD